MNTVRTYYRNAVLAFPNTTEYACAVTRPPSRLADRCVVWALCLSVIVVALTVAFVGPAV